MVTLIFGQNEGINLTQKSKQIQRHVGCSTNEIYVVISSVKIKYFLLLYFHRICRKILRDCHCRCFQFVVSFKMICYLLILSKKWQSYEYLTTYFKRVVYICTQRDDVCTIQQRYFICRSVYTISEMHKWHVQGHCTAYHFRILLGWMTECNTCVYDGFAAHACTPKHFPALFS